MKLSMMSDWNEQLLCCVHYHSYLVSMDAVDFVFHAESINAWPHWLLPATNTVYCTVSWEQSISTCMEESDNSVS